MGAVRRKSGLFHLASALAGLGLLADASSGSAQGLAPGTVKVLSKNSTLVDAGTGDGYVQINATEPGKFLVVGPGTLQADFRMNLAADVNLFGIGKRRRFNRGFR